MKRKVVLALVGCLCAISLVACKDTSTENNETEVSALVDSSSSQEGILTDEPILDSSVEPIPDSELPAGAVTSTGRIKVEPVVIEKGKFDVSFNELPWDGIENVSYAIDLHLVAPSTPDIDKDLYDFLAQDPNNLSIMSSDRVLNHKVRSDYKDGYFSSIKSIEDNIYGVDHSITDSRIYDLVNDMCYVEYNQTDINGYEEEAYRFDYTGDAGLPRLVLVEGAEDAYEEFENSYEIFGEFDTEALYGVSKEDLGVPDNVPIISKINFSYNGVMGMATVHNVEEIKSATGYKEFSLSFNVMSENEEEVNWGIPDYMNDFEYRKGD